MEPRSIELYHPDVNGGNLVSMVVQMTRIYCSPPDHTGRRRMDDIDIVVPFRSDEQRLLHEFEEAIICGPSAITPMRLVAGNRGQPCRWVVDKEAFIRRRNRAVLSLLLGIAAHSARRQPIGIVPCQSKGPAPRQPILPRGGPVPRCRGGGTQRPYGLWGGRSERAVRGKTIPAN